ncbi:MAG: response regulator [Calothrix sp. MO_167.B42]|nr:response regulator [Calothrix sp. MO_167.B42]
MTNPQKIGLKNLINGLHKFSQMQYNGQLKIESTKGQKWSLYFRLGRTIWATGGKQPFRRWRRQMASYCPNIKTSSISLNHEDLQIEYWDYIILDKLFSQQKIERKQVNFFVEKAILEVLFDISQESNFNSVVVEHFQNNIFDKPISFVNIDVCLESMMQAKNTWAESGLANFSPNSAPVIDKSEQLKKILNPNTYKNFTSLVNGKYTLRDLAIKMNKAELFIARSLLPYILKGIVKLVEVPDLPLKINPSEKYTEATETKAEKAPLIACIDDSPQICKMMEQIILSRGFRVISITDSIEALSILIKEKPNLIFLDLVMPVANGYEICTQLRRVSIFKNIPVIIVSANASLVDRIFRSQTAKVVGATDFINKPISTHKVLGMIDKYLDSQSSVAKSIPEKV